MTQPEEDTAYEPTTPWIILTWPTRGRETQAIAICVVILIALATFGVSTLKHHPWIALTVMTVTVFLYLLIGCGIFWLDQQLNKIDIELSGSGPTADMLE